jgi:tetratricopeptide (TPR) repeat protein
MEFGATLGVNYVLSGRIRLANGKILVTLELIEVRDGSQIWGTLWQEPLEDIFGKHQRLVREINSQLLATRSSAIGGTTIRNLDSYRSFLRGKHLMWRRQQDELAKAVESFEKSISWSPLFLPAYIELGETLLLQYFSGFRNRDNTLKRISELIIRFDSTISSNSELFALKGAIAKYLNWDFLTALKHYESAIFCNPQSLIARYRFSDLLISLRRFEDAKEQLEWIITLDPLSVSSCKQLAKCYFRMSMFENAIAFLEDALELESSDYISLATLGAALVEINEFDRAQVLFERSLNTFVHPEIESMMGDLYARQGKEGEAYRIIDKLKKNSSTDCSIFIARILGQLGEIDAAFDYLEIAYRAKEPDLHGLFSDPRLKPLQSDSRLIDLANRVGLLIP